jgi:hypothetical protein
MVQMTGRCMKVPFDGYIYLARRFFEQVALKPLKFELQNGILSQVESFE